MTPFEVTDSNEPVVRRYLRRDCPYPSERFILGRTCDCTGEARLGDGSNIISPWHGHGRSGNYFCLSFNRVVSFTLLCDACLLTRLCFLALPRAQHSGSLKAVMADAIQRWFMDTLRWGLGQRNCDIPSLSHLSPINYYASIRLKFRPSPQVLRILSERLLLTLLTVTDARGPFKRECKEWRCKSGGVVVADACDRLRVQ